MRHDEEVSRLEIVRRKYSHEEKKNLIREYAELRQLLKNPHATMKVYVLEPICEFCRFGRAPMEDGDADFDVSRSIRPPRDNCYMYPAGVRTSYYAAEHGIVIREADGYDIRCVRCQEDLSEETLLYVSERSFQDYFCLEDKSNGLPKWLRKHVLECYGGSCFGCGWTLTATKLTIDHIIPRARGGTHQPTNLQPLCEACNNAKQDKRSETAYVFLDFLMRPAPSDAYAELIW